MNERFTKVSNTSDLQPGSKTRVEVDGESVLIANVGGTIYAISDTCTHRACSLSKGSIEGNVVVCPCHSGRFDLRTGKVVSPPPRIDASAFDVQIQGSEVMVKKR